MAFEIAKIRPVRYGNLNPLFWSYDATVIAKIRPVRYGNMDRSNPSLGPSGETHAKIRPVRYGNMWITKAAACSLVAGLK